VLEFADWLAGTWLSLFIQRELWAIPALQSVHIMAIAAVVSSALFINLKLLGIADRSHRLMETGGRFLPWIWGGLIILATTGLLLVIGEPKRELMSVPFWIKMVLVAIGAGTTLWFQTTLRAHQEILDAGGVVRGVRLYAFGTLLIWVCVITAGRLIAYVY
jgi:hypothetical protein